MKVRIVFEELERQEMNEFLERLEERFKVIKVKEEPARARRTNTAIACFLEIEKKQ